MNTDVDRETGAAEISVVVVGHVNHGKSTTIGRLLYDTGSIGEGELEQLAAEARSRGNKTSAFAFAMDQFEEERDRMVTIDTRSRQVQLGDRTFHFADAPGHRKWIRNVIMGSMFADAALLVVRADRGPEAQTREHTWISKRLFGIDQMVVAIEMMDLVDYREERFEAVRQRIKEVLDEVDHVPETVTFVPIAAYQGENITTASTEMDWWDGPTLTDALQTFDRDTPDPMAPVRYLCLESFRDIGRDAVLASGLVLQGTLSTAERITFLPADKTVDIAAIEDMGAELDAARPEDRVTLVIDDSDAETDDIFVEDIQRGYFAVTEDDPLQPVERFAAELYLCKNEVAEGDAINVWVYGNTVPATVTDIVNVRDAVSGSATDDGVLSFGQIADIHLELQDPVVIQPITETRETSMFIAMKDELAIGYGNATEVEG